MKYIKLFENDELNSKSLVIDIVMIPSGEVLSVEKEKLFTLIEYDPEFEVIWNDDIDKFTVEEELKEDFLKLLNVDWNTYTGY